MPIQCSACTAEKANNSNRINNKISHTIRPHDIVYSIEIRLPHAIVIVITIADCHLHSINNRVRNHNLAHFVHNYIWWLFFLCAHTTLCWCQSVCTRQNIHNSCRKQTIRYLTQNPVCACVWLCDAWYIMTDYLTCDHCTPKPTIILCRGNFDSGMKSNQLNSMCYALYLSVCAFNMRGMDSVIVTVSKVNACKWYASNYYYRRNCKMSWFYFIVVYLSPCFEPDRKIRCALYTKHTHTWPCEKT